MKLFSMIAILALAAGASAQETKDEEPRGLSFKLDIGAPAKPQSDFRCDDARVIPQPAPIFQGQSDALAIHSRAQARHIAQINRRTTRGCSR
ncbi:MAG: hypothetical protein AAGE80_10800 [Pseudomonadota bacterium]